MTAITNGRETVAPDAAEPRFSGDDGDASADVLGIGYPEAALELAEAADELDAVERSEPDELGGEELNELQLDGDVPARLVSRRRGELAALGVTGAALALVGALVGGSIARSAAR